MKKVALVAVVWGLALLQSTPARAETPTDLGTVLASPGSGYNEVTASNAYLVGPFVADDYAAWDTVGDRSRLANEKKALNDNGFIRGFGRAWVKPRTDYKVMELALEFADRFGSGSWNEMIRIGTSEAQDYAQLPDAWIFRASGTQWIGFAKGNDVYLVGVASDKDDLSQFGKQQADAQYRFAPASTTTPPTVVPSTRQTAPTAMLRASLRPILWVAMGIIILIAVGTAGTIGALAFRQAGSRRPRAG